MPWALKIGCEVTTWRVRPRSCTACRKAGDSSVGAAAAALSFIALKLTRAAGPGDAALYVDEPESVDAWARGLRALTDDGALQSSLRLRGTEQAAKFSWNATADLTLEVLRQAAAT